jgi:CO/xanthine dehydrogenase Mo-binding subunit
VGYWRSVGNSFNAFVMESTIDEIASATGADPYLLRRQLLANDARSLAVLDAAATLAGWGTPVAVGHARGIAIAPSFGSIVAEVAEVSAPTATTIKVHNVACAVDCGFAMNPNSVEAQMQGGIMHGLSAALWGQVTFKAGVASARNFSNYPTARMKDAPAIAVQIINSGAAPSGTGEPGVPPIGPAVAAAYFKVTGKRVRTLPFFPGTTMSEG